MDISRPSSSGRSHLLIAALLFAIVSLQYAITAVSLAAHAPLWMDEVLAVRTARLVNPAAIWRALVRGAEFTPPLYDVLLGRLIASGLDSPLAFRLPSIIAGYGAALAIGSIAWRRYGPVPAALAAGIVLSSGLFTVAVQARPYAILAAVFALALAVRDRPPGVRLTRARTVVLTALLVTMVALHFYAPLLVATLALIEAGEAASARRAPSRRVIVAATIAGASMLCWWPILVAARAFSRADVAAPAYYGRPNADALLIGYVVTTGWLVIPLLLLSLAVVRAGTRRGAPPVAALALLAIPLGVFVFALFVSHSFAVRYVVTGAFGVALLAVALAGRLGDRAGAAGLLLLAALPIGNAAWRISGDLAQPARPAAIAMVARAPGTLPIVTGSGLRFLELSGNVPAAIRRRLFYLDVPGDASPDPTNRHQVLRWNAIDPTMRVAAAPAFVTATPAFLVFAEPGAGDPDPLPGWLVRHIGTVPPRTDRATLTLVRTSAWHP